MYSEAVEVLLGMGEYQGALDAFLHESTARIEAAFQCSSEEADRILQDLRSHGGVDFEGAAENELPVCPTGIPHSRWYWYVPPAA